MPLNISRMESRRKQLGLSQAQAARRAGLASRQVWSDIASGRRSNITLQTLEGIAHALDLDPCSLLTHRSHA